MRENQNDRPKVIMVVRVFTWQGLRLCEISKWYKEEGDFETVKLILFFECL